MLPGMRPESLQDRTKREWAEATAGKTEFGQAGEFPRSPMGDGRRRCNLFEIFRISICLSERLTLSSGEGSGGEDFLKLLG